MLQPFLGGAIFTLETRSFLRLAILQGWLCRTCEATIISFVSNNYQRKIEDSSLRDGIGFEEDES
jgi:hypothetical protein